MALFLADAAREKWDMNLFFYDSCFDKIDKCELITDGCGGRTFQDSGGTMSHRHDFMGVER